jgi:predicted PurR-regulated permease PerM
VLALITASIGYIIMRAVGLDFAGFWAVLIFFFYYIPTVGSLLAVISPTLLTLVQFDSLTPFLIVAICMGVVQIGMANFVEPLIMGRSLNVSPFIMILSLMVFGTLWGVVGMFLCVPIMVIAMIIMGNFPQTRGIAVLISADGNVQLPERKDDKLED